MNLTEIEIGAAEGISIFSEIKLGDITLEKGHKLTQDDIVNLRLWGIKTVFGGVIESTDVAFDTAAKAFAAALCGENTAYFLDVDNICKIVADKDGFFKAEDDRIAKFNRNSGGIILNTIEPYGIVKKGNIIAKLEVVPAFISEDEVNKIIFSLSGNVPMLSIAESASPKAALIYAKFYDHAEETKYFTQAVKKLVSNFDYIDFVEEYSASYNKESLADALLKVKKSGVDIAFILSGQRDTIASLAIESITENVFNLTIPEVELSDLIIASYHNMRIINLPYYYAKKGSDLADKFIRKTIANKDINQSSFTHPQNVLLSKIEFTNKEENLIKASNKLSEKESNIAAIVLAAGISSRAGRNKLLFELENGQPLFIKAVNAAIKSKASPVFVITGHQNEEMEKHLEDIDINIIHNPNFRAGIKTSINLGLSAIPGFCEGALLIPADMPNVSHGLLNKLISAFKKGDKKQVCIAGFNGAKNNPILWGRDLFAVADVVPESADSRPIFVEHSDYTNLVEVKKADDLFDINFPADLEKLKK